MRPPEQARALLGVPGADVASAVVALWCEYLEIGQVDPQEDFFRLGGDSLLAIRMLAAVDDAFGV